MSQQEQERFFDIQDTQTLLRIAENSRRRKFARNHNLAKIVIDALLIAAAIATLLYALKQ